MVDTKDVTIISTTYVEAPIIIGQIIIMQGQIKNTWTKMALIKIQGIHRILDTPTTPAAAVFIMTIALPVMTGTRGSKITRIFCPGNPAMKKYPARLEMTVMIQEEKQMTGPLNEDLPCFMAIGNNMSI